MQDHGDLVSQTAEPAGVRQLPEGRRNILKYHDKNAAVARTVLERGLSSWLFFIDVDGDESRTRASR